jgi:hypothetical protein
MIGYRIQDVTSSPIVMTLTEDTYSLWTSLRMRDEVMADAGILAETMAENVSIQSPDGRELELVEVP